MPRVTLIVLPRQLGPCSVRIGPACGPATLRHSQSIVVHQIRGAVTPACSSLTDLASDAACQQAPFLLSVIAVPSSKSTPRQFAQRLLDGQDGAAYLDAAGLYPKRRQ